MAGNPPPTIEDYGHAVAAPLLARIAELEAQAERERLAQLACDAESSCFDVELNSLQDSFASLSLECDRLRAEVETLQSELAAERAASVIEWEPGRSYTAAELLRRAIRGIRGRNGRSICPAVENLFGCGNTVARYLCRWAGRDPDTGKEIAARKGVGGEG